MFVKSCIFPTTYIILKELQILTLKVYLQENIHHKKLPLGSILYTVLKVSVTKFTIEYTIEWVCLNRIAKRSETLAFKQPLEHWNFFYHWYRHLLKGHGPVDRLVGFAGQ